MFFKTTVLALFFAIFVGASPASSAPVDSVKGEWLGVFAIAGHTAEVTMAFQVHGSQLSGTIVSEHTGPGVVTNGKWEDSKLSCTLKFEKHESIEFWGTLKDGKLSGEFKTEGMTGTWTATRKS